MNDRQADPSASVSLETVCSLGHHPRRRSLIRVLATHDRELTLNDLTKELIRCESEEDITAVSGEKALRVAASLRHKHLPKLADSDMVSYNTDRNLIEPTDKLAAVDAKINAIADGEQNGAAQTTGR